MDALKSFLQEHADESQYPDTWDVASMALWQLERKLGAFDELVAALERVARVLPGAFLPGPVYLSLSEAAAIREALARAREV